MSNADNYARLGVLSHVIKVGHVALTINVQMQRKAV